MKKKKFIIIALVLVIILITTTTTFASELTVELPNYPSDCTHKEYIIVKFVKDNHDVYWLCAFDELQSGYEVLVYDDVEIDLETFKEACFYKYIPNVNTEWVFDESLENVSLDLNLRNKQIIYSSVDIFYKGDIERVFFCSTPQKMKHFQWGGMTSGTIVTPILTMIGGIMVVVLLSVIGLVALRKAWNHLVIAFRGA